MNLVDVLFFVGLSFFFVVLCCVSFVLVSNAAEDERTMQEILAAGATARNVACSSGGLEFSCW